MNPAESFVRANGIDHHVLEWNPGGERTFVLAHGFLDIAWSWKWVAERLADAGARVVAFDWRGHGESSWIGDGGYYHFADYVLDLDELLPALGIERAHLVGHSMGGTAVALYAGTRPDVPITVTLVEGLGPPSHGVDILPDRYGSFLRSVRAVRSAKRQVLPDLDAAVTRLAAQNPGLPDEVGRFVAERATRPGPEGHGYVWRFDPLHRTTSPTAFQAEAFHAFLGHIASPTLYVCGDQGFRLPDERQRLDKLKKLAFVEFAGTGHMIHWFRPAELSAELLRFAVQT
ncbi:MAG: alpha/beta hydrolase [Polyangiales bacterium]|nr:alpha/beta hydrolase [Myxococcales bacterium]